MLDANSLYFAAPLLSRTPQYVGTCTPRVPCSNATTADTAGRLQVLYSCSAASLPSPSAACGNLCDTQNICAALCECDVPCGAAEVSKDVDLCTSMHGCDF